ncbi:MAG: FtsX-like permease family protein [Sediminicola sp.]
MKNTSPSDSKVGIDWLLKMAWRDGKASGSKLLLFMASMVLGIAAVVAIQSFGATLKDNIVLQSKSLMGSDFKIDGSGPANERVLQIMDSLGGPQAREINFSSMVAFPKNMTSKLAQVRGVEGAFPLYGTLETSPLSAGSTYQNEGAALVDATLMLQLGVQEGDSIKVGALTLPIAGSLNSAPGSSAIFSSIAPPVLIPYRFLEATGLLQTGSRLDYEYYFKAGPSTDLERLSERLEPILEAQDADLDTHLSTSRRLGRRYENFGKFLNLVAFMALLLGCVGIASAINVYIKEKLRSVAVLKCLGASRKQTFLIYLLQITVLGLMGGIIGTGFGLLLQQLFPLLLKGLLPVEVHLYWSAQAIFTGILLGIFMSVLFALYPLMDTLYVSPLQALRVRDDNPEKSGKAALFVSLGIFVFIFLFSYWLLHDWRYSLAFVGGILATFAILAGVARMFMGAIKRFFPHSFGFCARQSLLNLFRPKNQTITLVLAIGVGSFLISTLYFTKDLLLSQATLENSANSPNIILLDIQTGQKDAVAKTIKDNGLPILDDIAIITMRIQKIGESTVDEIRRDTTSKVNNWILNHEFRVTYRDSLIGSESLAEGKWIGKREGAEMVPISVSDNFAEDAKVAIGDNLTFNVQGVLLETTVASIRTVDWSRMQLNFSVVFPTGVLERAPQFRVLTTKAADATVSAGLQRDLVGQFPNVSILDLRQLLTVLEGLLDKISWIINFMAFFSILTGVIVLIGAVRTSKYQRIKESVLLRTLGAKSGQIIKINALEYLYLGLLGSFAGILLSLIGTQILAWTVFDTSFVPSPVPFLVLLPSIVILVVLVGLLNSRSVISSPPLEVLRKEID